jgi:hypothetical protein
VNGGGIRKGGKVEEEVKGCRGGKLLGREIVVKGI